MSFLNQQDRRGEQRVCCSQSSISGQLMDLLDEKDHAVFLWDLSLSGVRFVVERRFSRGTRLLLEINATDSSNPLKTLVEVRHADVCCPSFREAWFTGCSRISNFDNSA